ncbi:hypothetical protein [Lysobacter gummosus]|uniref:hypothetical protein n=1 Tax=Lysobacter gummosus TaxID=262324 RepID=UPI0036313151
MRHRLPRRRESRATRARKPKRRPGWSVFSNWKISTECARFNNAVADVGRSTAVQPRRCGGAQPSS